MSSKSRPRATFASGSRWEPVIGYSRAVRAGCHIFVSGTTATDTEGRVLAPGDAGAQAEECLRRIEAVLLEAGSSLADVVRTRIYVADIDAWEAVGEVHRKVFGEIRPAATMVEISRFIMPGILVEIEVDAVVAEC
ncbi:MAG TPA: RidA family protein [Gammaproteobacteria bacterium]|nr:RidA family protein [Gammaproteobacteria bacterium]